MLKSAVTSSRHFTRLGRAYKEVGDRTWLTGDFLDSNLEVSRNLFTLESLVARRPQPRALEVFALLSGLPFRADFTDKLVEVQQQISGVLGERLHYWVAPANLGVEYCVFKWPTDAWNEEWLGIVHDVLAAIRQPSFRFSVCGVQINPDGCVIAKGFDEHAVLFQIREQLKTEIPFLPSKQSRWAHVPLGRILEPLGGERFAKLVHLMRRMSVLTIATTEINSMKLVHETRWYMEAKTILAEYPLSSVSDRLKS